MTIRRSRLTLAALLLMTAFGCAREHHAAPHEPRTLKITKTFHGDYPIRAVCTTGMVADLVRTVGGPQVNVEQLLGADVDPHQYKATPADVAQLGGAHVIFFSGLHLEGKMADLLERLGRTLPAVAIGEYLPHDKILTDPEGRPDPHVWFDVALWSQGVAVVADALGQHDPANASAYKERAEQYQAELAKLHAKVAKRLAGIPKERRVLITSHDAFRYFERAYAIEVRGIQGISTESEASVRDVNRLVDLITRRQIKAVFVESSVNPRNMLALVEGCKARGHDVTVGGQLYSDAMGAPGTPEGTYAGMVLHNVETIAKALE